MLKKDFAVEQVTKALDLIKASGWQNAMLSLGAWLYIWSSRNDYVPPLEGGWIAIAHVVAFVTGALALASAGSQVQRLGGFLIKIWKAWYLKRAVQKRFRKQIGFFDVHEQRIFGYLLHHKLKAFETAVDGGYASKLIGQGFVVGIAQAGQVFGMDDMPVKVPEYIWEVLEERRGDFPHMPVYSDDSRHSRSRTEVHPWRVPWQLR